MTNTDVRKKGAAWLIVLIVATLGLALVAGQTPRVAAAGDATPTATPTAVWPALQTQTPYAYASPLPTPAVTPLDGTYAKLDQSPPQWWACRRCADYRPVGGTWKLQLDRGVLRILYEVTGWHSLASYAVADDRLVLFNDPYCPAITGAYRWTLADNRLALTVIEDACAFGLRARTLTQQKWPTCDPSAARQPVGCADFAPPGPITASLPVTVSVLGGDSRFFATPPALIVPASLTPDRVPEGIELDASLASFPYGLNRVLWWNGPWATATTERPDRAIGVQFMGDAQMGWARVLFDGVEVWRGDTAAIWSRNGRYGGYVEVSGFAPGRHTLRVVALGLDHRPVMVAGFGFGDAEVAVPDK